MKGQASRFPEAASFAQVPMPNLLLLQEQARKRRTKHCSSSRTFIPMTRSCQPKFETARLQPYGYSSPDSKFARFNNQQLTNSYISYQT